MIESPPLALNAQDGTAHLEGEVVSTMLGHGPEDGDPETGGRCCDLKLGQRSLAVSTEHEHMFANQSDGTLPSRSSVTEGRCVPCPTSPPMQCWGT